MDHLDVMACPVRPHVSAARLAIYLGRDLAENRRNDFPGVPRTTRHQRRPFECAFLAAGNPAADEMNSASFQVLATALCVSEQRIATVNDHVPLFQERRELADDRVHW